MRGHRHDPQMRAGLSLARRESLAVASSPPISGIWMSISTTSNDLTIERGQRLEAVVGDGDLVSAPGQQPDRDPLIDLVVFGEEHAQRAGGESGRWPRGWCLDRDLRARG